MLTIRLLKFICNEIGTKAAHKMLVKLTTGLLYQTRWFNQEDTLVP